MSDPGAELTRITDELIEIQTKINELRESGVADDAPELVALQKAAADNDAAYQAWASEVRDSLDQ